MPNIEYERRLEEAKRIADFFKGRSHGVLLTGSVAYASDYVTENSDLDLTVVLDLKDFNYRDFSRATRAPHEEIAADIISQGKVQAAIIRWERGFKVGLNLWDKISFEHLANMHHGIVRILREAEFSGNSKSERLFNLRGAELSSEIPDYLDEKRTREFIQGRAVQKLHPIFETHSDVYLSAVPNNFILDPHILSEREDYIGRQIRHFLRVLRSKLAEKYGLHHDSSVSLLNVIPEEFRNKINGTELERQLGSFF